MRRAVTFSLVVLTVFLWAASLWRLSARVTGMDLVYAGIPAGLALLLLIGFAVSGRIFNPNDNVRRVFSAVLAVTLLLTIGLVYADIFVFSGEIFERGLAIWAQSVYGSAKMVLETGKHPGELKDAVCSPAGTTIEAVAALEAGGFRSTVISAQRACSQKSRDMSSK